MWEPFVLYNCHENIRRYTVVRDSRQKWYGRVQYQPFNQHYYTAKHLNHHTITKCKCPHAHRIFFFATINLLSRFHIIHIVLEMTNFTPKLWVKARNHFKSPTPFPYTSNKVLVNPFRFEYKRNSPDVHAIDETVT